MTKGIQCFRCRRRSPKASIKNICNCPLGPNCYETISKRMSLRGLGPNSRMRETETGLVILTSDISNEICPDDTHCLDCPYMEDQVCPLENHLEYTDLKNEN